MKKELFLFIVVAVSIVGCSSVGNVPEPATGEQLIKDLETKTPEEQIKWWNDSPAPAAQKQQKIDEIKKKYNLADAPVSTAPGAPPVGGSGAPTGK